jgi:cell division septum initiation protein DivIVA
VRLSNASCGLLQTNLYTPIAHREWSHCLKEVASFSDRLLDLKEATIDPLKAFYNGSKRTIFDDISGFLRDEAPNFVDLPADDIAPLRAAVETRTAYKGNTLQQANAKLSSVREAVSKLVTEAREEAAGRLAKARESFVSSPEFTALDSDKRADLLEPFDAATTRLKTERLAPVVREAAERAATELLPSQLQKASSLILREGGDDEDPAPEYVTVRKIHVPFKKTVLENEEDLAAYLDAIRETYSATLRNNKRITL